MNPKCGLLRFPHTESRPFPPPPSLTPLLTFFFFLSSSPLSFYLSFLPSFLTSFPLSFLVYSSISSHLTYFLFYPSSLLFPPKNNVESIIAQISDRIAKLKFNITATWHNADCHKRGWISSNDFKVKERRRGGNSFPI